MTEVGYKILNTKITMAKKTLISIIIVNWNGIAWLKKCLTSLEKQTEKNFEAILVDNCSSDGSADYVRQYFPWVILVDNLQNVGFDKANNQAAALTHGDYIFLLAHDAYLDTDTLEKLAHYINTYPYRNLMQLDTRNYDKTYKTNEVLSFIIDPFGYPMWSGKKDKIFYADGAALVVKRSLFYKLRGYDEKYFMYLEDVDFAWRARLLGNEVYFLTGIHAYHFGGSTTVATKMKGHKYVTSTLRRYHAQKNNLRSLIKNYSLKNLVWTLPVSVALASIEGWLYLIKGNINGFYLLHKAILWNAFNIFDTLKQRKYIQQIRIVGDENILRDSYKGISKINSFFLHGVPSMK